MENGQLETLVREAILSRPGFPPAKVMVEAFDGRVTLMGDVETLAQEAEALLAAKSVAGVREVISALRVYETERLRAEPIDDAMLTEQIERELLDHGIVIQDGGVTVSGAEVYLQGRVGSAKQRIEAGRIATTLKGARRVHNRLQQPGERAKGKKVMEQE